MATVWCDGGSAAKQCECGLSREELGQNKAFLKEDGTCVECKHKPSQHRRGGGSGGDTKQQPSTATATGLIDHATDLMLALCTRIGDTQWFSSQPLEAMRRAQNALTSLYPGMREQIGTLTVAEAKRRFHSIKLHVSSRTAAHVQIESGYFVNGPLSGPMTREGGRITYDRLHTGHSSEPHAPLMVFKLYDTEEEAVAEHKNIAIVHDAVVNPFFVTAAKPVPLRAASHESTMPAALRSGWVLPMIEIGPTVVEAYSLYAGHNGLPHTILFSAALSAAIALWGIHSRGWALRDLKTEHFLARRCFGGDQLGVEFVMCDAGSMHRFDRPLADPTAGTTFVYYDATDDSAPIGLPQRDIRLLGVSLFHMLTGDLPSRWSDVCSITKRNRPNVPHYQRPRHWTTATAIVHAAATAMTADDLLRALIPLSQQLDGNCVGPEYPLGRWFQSHAAFIVQFERELPAIFAAALLVRTTGLPQDLCCIVAAYAVSSVFSASPASASAAASSP